jgi:hypothetical protein
VGVTVTPALLPARPSIPLQSWWVPDVSSGPSASTTKGEYFTSFMPNESFPGPLIIQAVYKTREHSSLLTVSTVPAYRIFIELLDQEPFQFFLAF